MTVADVITAACARSNGDARAYFLRSTMVAGRAPVVLASAKLVPDMMEEFEMLEKTLHDVTLMKQVQNLPHSQGLRLK